MATNRLCRLSSVVVVVCLATPVGWAAQEVATRPNLVVMRCDDLGYANIGFNGSKDITTPALDQLARNGTAFSSAYVPQPFCGPSATWPQCRLAPVPPGPSATGAWGRSHVEPLWFDDLDAANAWRDKGMPVYEKPFQTVDVQSSSIKDR